MAGTKTVSGFGLRDVAIAPRPSAPATTPSWTDVPSVESAAFKLEVGEVEQWGDDVYQGTWYHSQKGKINVKGNKLSTLVLEKLSGNTVSAVTGGKEALFIGTDLELVPPKLIVRATVPVRNSSTGAAGVMEAFWFDVDCKTIWDNMPGSERAKLVEVMLEMNTYASTQDEKGDPLPAGITTAFGKLVI